MTITEAAAALRDRALTSVDLLAEATRRADALDGRLGAYLVRFDEEAHAAAERADADFAAGIDHGPLQGIPIAVKDLVAAREGPTTAQSLVLDPAWGDGRDATVVARLRAAGAVITGKVSLEEFACGVPDGTGPFPVPRNPWDTERWAGGSSSGSASGVAAGFFLGAIGSDTAGSIRIPAAYCGVCGLLPTAGRVSNAGSVPFGFSLDRLGPVARTAADCGTILAAIDGQDEWDPATVHAPAADGSAVGLRVGVARQAGLEPAVADAFEEALAVLGSLGAETVEVALPHHRDVVSAHMVTLVSEAFAYHRNDLRDRPEDYLASTRAFIELGERFSGADYVQAQRVRRVAQRALACLFDDLEVIATPTVSHVAPPLSSLGRRHPFEAVDSVFTPYWNAVGCPALAVPMGFDTDGLPVSLQLGARPFGEPLLVGVGQAYQRCDTSHLVQPSTETWTSGSSARDTHQRG
jgi:Asp-tRNA(Asn)/Glu-tRNA(Gln) amidotransferase A subunit family amidase